MKSFSLDNKTILLTGATGSFGKAFIQYLLKKSSFKGTIRAFSRDEYKQYELQKIYSKDDRLRFFIGDVRDGIRVKRAMEGVQVVVHAAALKHVPILEYNPFEAVKTNIIGTQNIIENAIDLKVKKAVLISSDKAVFPVNLYGATKLVAEKMFVQANAYVGKGHTALSVIRYGNVVASRGSVIPNFLEQSKNNSLTVTDERMTRFSLTLEEGVRFVIQSIKVARGGEIFVPKIPSLKIMDLVKAISPQAKLKFIGIRPGEKLHEVLINQDEARHAFEFSKFYIIYPQDKNFKNNSAGGKRLEEFFSYTSETNNKWLSIKEIKKVINSLKNT